MCANRDLWLINKKGEKGRRHGSNLRHYYRYSYTVKQVTLVIESIHYKCFDSNFASYKNVLYDKREESFELKLQTSAVAEEQVKFLHNISSLPLSPNILLVFFRRMASKPLSIPDWFANKNVLITGGTGFMGKILIFKLLLSCPDIGEIFLVIRKKKGVDSQTRLHLILQVSRWARIFIRTYSIYIFAGRKWECITRSGQFRAKRGQLCH